MGRYEDLTHLPKHFGIKKGAEKFPLMVVVAASYICNSRCPQCPYTNSAIRQSYADAQLIEPQLFRKIADECSEHNAFLRISGGGEPLLHPQLVDLIEYAKRVGARVGLITNGSVLTPEKADRLLAAGTDVIEISADAADKKTYSRIRVGLDFDRLMRNVLYLVNKRNEFKSDSKVVVSVVNQKAIADNLDSIVAFWKKIVDNVIIRKYLSWGIVNPEDSGDPTPYLPTRVPCPFPFERLNIDTRGTVTFCGYDIRGETNFGNVRRSSIQRIWKGKKFNAWRELLLKGQYEKISLCWKCSDWRYRSWNYNYWYMLEKAERIREERLIGKLKSQGDLVVVLGDE